MSSLVSRLTRQRAGYLRLSISLALWLAACTSQLTGPVLNSERIRQTFGSYGVDVLYSDSSRRISSLYSGDGSDKTTRTYAVVDFVDATSSALATQHALVKSGQSIGAVFRAAGWSIEKRQLFIGELEVPADYQQIGELMRIGLPRTLAVNSYLFVVSKDGQPWNYAIINEVHHPDFLSGGDLQRLYGEILFDDSNRKRIGDFIGAADQHP